MGCFPLELQKLLVSRELDQKRLTLNMHRRGYRISKQFISLIMCGGRPCPPGQVQRISETLQCDDQERLKLHKAAAIDYGYEVGPL